MFCNKCGNELPEGASFCTSCGARQNNSMDTPPAIENKETPAIPPLGDYTQQVNPYPVEPEIKPKKKRIALKVVLALVLILVLGAGVTVLGYYTFLPAKTTLLIAQYSSVLSSYDTFDKELTQYENKFLKPLFEDTLANESELSFSLDRSLLEMSELDPETISLVEESLKNLSLSFGYGIDAKNEKQKMNIGLNYMKNPALSANFYLNGTQFGLGVPELFERTIVGDLKNLDNLPNLMPDVYEEDLNLIEDMDPWMSVKAYDEIKIDRKALKNVMSDFSQTLVKSLDSSDMSIKRGKTTELFGKDTKCQEITIELDQKAQKKIIGNLLTMAKDNKDFYDLTIGNLLKFMDILAQNPVYADLLEELDLEETLSKSNYKATLLDLKGSLEESLFLEEIVVKVYIKGLEIVKYDFSIPVEDEELILTIEVENDGLSHKTKVALSGDMYDESLSMTLDVEKKHDSASDTSDLLVELNLDADTYDFVGNMNLSLESKEKSQSKNEVAHEITTSLKVENDTYGDSEIVEMSVDISGTKVRNSKHLVTESSYQGNLNLTVPNEFDQSLGIGFALDSQTTYGEKIEIPTPDQTLDLATATQDDIDEIIYEIYDKLGAIQMLIEGMM